MLSMPISRTMPSIGLHCHELRIDDSEADKKWRIVYRIDSDAMLSQESLANRINSSQSRVAKMETSDPSVSLDLIVRTLLAMGATREDVAGAIASSSS